jgi:outer membrane protein assembly factor BamB
VEVAPLIHGPDLYLATTDRRIHRLAVESGEKAWKKKIDGVVSGLPWISGNHLYAATARPDGSVYLMNLDTKKVVWRTPVGDAAGGVVAFEDMALAATQDGKVYGLSTHDGRPIWVTNLETLVWGSATLDTTRALLLVPGRTGKLFGVDARSGEKRWVADLGKPLAGANGGPDGIAAISIQGDLYFVNGETGALEWSKPLAAPMSAAPVIAGDQILVAMLDGVVAAFRAGNGSPTWRKDLGGPFRTEPAVSGNQVALTAPSGQVWVLDLETGDVLGTTRHPETVLVSPVPAPGGWVVAGERGLVIAYRWNGSA